MSKTRCAGKALQTEAANVPRACLICTLISLCHFCLQIFDLPGESEMIHLALILPMEKVSFSDISRFRGSAHHLKEYPGSKE